MNNSWAPYRRKSLRGSIPFGYFPDPDDKLNLIPDPVQVEAIEEGFDFLDQGLSLREVSEYVTEKSGRSISHQGLRHLWAKYRGHTPATKKRIAANRAVKAKPKTMTREERKIERAKQKAAKLKRSITFAKKALDNTQGRIEELTGTAPVVREVPQTRMELEEPVEEKDKEIFFKPNPGPQTEFLAAPEKEVLYGGAAGGGKSYALLADPMRYFDNPNFRGLILRKTNDELRELIGKARQLYGKVFPKARWQAQQSQFVFPSGATLWFTYLERDDDLHRYQGQAFSYIAFDELTHHATPNAWIYMRSRLRTDDPTLPTYMRATTNPGGPGHGWVKKMFFDPAPPNTTFPAIDLETGEPLVYPKGHKKEGEPLITARFIPASLYDNPYLANDGQYEASLLSMPEHQRRQLLDGDWTVNSGAAFPEFNYKIHTCDPFTIPYDWPRFRAADYGYSTFSAVLWFTVDPSTGQIIVYDELYVSKATGYDLARMVLQKEHGQRVQYGVLDSSCWHERGNTGPTIAEEMIRAGCRWRKADRSPNSRAAGRLKLHELLKTFPNPNGDGEIPGIVFFNNCRQIITDLPMIPTDPKGSDDIDPRYASDHAYDALRYGIMSRPSSQGLFDNFGSSSSSSYSVVDPIFGY